MKKLILSLLMVPLFAVALIGCGNDESTETETNDPALSQEQETNTDDAEVNTEDAEDNTEDAEEGTEADDADAE